MRTDLYEFGLVRLLESPAPEITQDIRRRAQDVVEEANVNIERIIQNDEARPRAGYVMDRDENGPFAAVSILSEGKVADYLSRKEFRERVWLVPALEKGFDK